MGGLAPGVGLKHLLFSARSSSMIASLTRGTHVVGFVVAIVASSNFADYLDMAAVMAPSTKAKSLLPDKVRF